MGCGLEDVRNDREEELDLVTSCCYWVVDELEIES